MQPSFISVKALIDCVWRNENYYTDALLLLVWFICVVIFVAPKKLIYTSREIRSAAKLLRKRFTPTVRVQQR